MIKGLSKIVLLIIFSVFVFWMFGNRQAVAPEISTPSPEPSREVIIPEGWETYTSENLGYPISYPEGFSVESNGDYSITLLKQSDVPSFGPANFIYVSVVPEEMFESSGEIYNYYVDQFKKLQGLEIGESVSLADTDQPDLSNWFTYTRVDDTEIEGYPARRFENNKPWEFPSGTTEVRLFFDTKGVIYILGYYYGGDGVAEPLDTREAFDIVSTFSLR